MPNLANITVKKNDGTTDIVWTGIQGSAGDGSPATWRSDTVGTSVAHRPVMEVVSSPNKAKTLRRVDYGFRYPEFIVGTDSIPRVVNTVYGGGFFSVNNAVGDAVVNEAASQYSNLLASILFKMMFKDRFAAS